MTAVAGHTPVEAFSAEHSARLDAAVDGVGITMEFQPLVRLADRARVGFEALARWPTLSGVNPQSVFAHAIARDTLDRLDRHCTDTAAQTALAHSMPAGALLMINSEPSSAYTARASDHPLMQARDSLQVVIELTERRLLAHPRVLLQKVANLRADGFAIALDDVGAHADSLALLDVVCPDIIKLDMNLVHSQPSKDQVRVLSGVLAHQERTGADILAEGIETEQHLKQAFAVGATLGQGFLFGRSTRLPEEGPNWSRWSLPDQRRAVTEHSGSLFDLVAQRCSVRTGPLPTLMSLSDHIESQAFHAADPPMVLTALQHAIRLTPGTQRRYQRLATRSPLVAVFGEDLPNQTEHGIRLVELDRTDPLCKEWVVLALGPHTAAALIAREYGHREFADQNDRRFDLAITYNRELVSSAARSLLHRMA